MKLVFFFFIVFVSSLASAQSSTRGIPLSLEFFAPEGVAVVRRGQEYIGDINELDRFNRSVFVENLTADFHKKNNGDIEVRLAHPIRLETINMSDFSVSELVIRSFTISSAEGFVLKLSMLASEGALFTKGAVEWVEIDEFKERVERGQFVDIFQDMKEGRGYTPDFYRFSYVQFGVSLSELSQAQEIRHNQVQVMGLPERHPRDAVYDLSPSRNPAIHTLEAVPEVLYDFEMRVMDYFDHVNEFTREITELRARNWLPVDEFDRLRIEAERRERGDGQVITFPTVRLCRRVFAL